MYNHLEIEKKWQEYWENNKTFKTDVWDFSKPKFYALDMFPYPSGVGLHAGHPGRLDNDKNKHQCLLKYGICRQSLPLLQSTRRK